MYHEGVIRCSPRPIINNPMMLQSHWPLKPKSVEEKLLTSGEEASEKDN